MKEQDELKLDVLDAIDDTLLEEHTARRISLLAGAARRAKRRRLLRGACACAASIVLFFAIAIPIWIWGGKQVPIYTGMTVSNTATPVAQAVRAPYAAPSPVTPTVGRFGSPVLFAHPIDQDKDKDKEEEMHEQIEEKIESTLGADAEQVGTYYAQPGQDVYVTIHFSNPDDFVIMSFTLNGKVYSGYMFEEGSDMENLILKCNVGEVAGIKEFTIDAIKYIDGTEIKDVIMDGERTVKVNVYTDAALPTVTASNLSVDYTSIGATLRYESDANSLFTLSGAQLYALLWDTKEIVSIQPLSLYPDKTVRFGSLSVNTPYVLAVATYFDARDGAGASWQIVYAKELTTLPVLTLTAGQPTDTALSFALSWGEGYGAEHLRSLALYCGQEKVRDLPLDATELTELYSGTAYTLVAEHERDGITERVTCDFTTKQNRVPTVVALTAPNLTHINFTLVITDPDATGALTDIRLLPVGGGAPIVLDDLSVRSFKDLPRLTAYDFQLTYTYDLRDGKGAQVMTKTLRTTTQTPGLIIEYNSVIDGVTHPAVIIDGLADDVRELEINLPISNRDLMGHATKQLRTLTLGPNVTVIGSNAFSVFNYLTTVNIEPGLQILGVGAFSECRQLINVALPDTIITIGGRAFSGCPSLRALTLPSSVTSIGQSAFRGCVGLTEATLSGEVGERAFSDCTGLKTVTLLDTVTAIGISAFQGCTSFQELHFSEDCALTKIGRGAFYDCVALVEITLPKKVTVLESSVFKGCSSLSSVTLPAGLTEIRGLAFANCTALMEIELPASVTAIHGMAFQNCTELREINLPDGLQSIGRYAFSNCISLTELILPASLQTVEDYAFVGCDALTLYARAAQAPSTWSMFFDYKTDDPTVYPAPRHEVNWGYTGE